MFIKEFEKRAVSAQLFGRAVSSAIGRQGAGEVANRLAKSTVQHADAGRVRSLVKRKQGIQQAVQAGSAPKPTGGTLDYSKFKDEMIKKNRTPVSPAKPTPVAPTSPAPIRAPAGAPKGNKVGQTFAPHRPYAEL